MEPNLLPVSAVLPLSPEVSLSKELNREDSSLPSPTLGRQPHSLRGPTPNLSVETDEYQNEEVERFMGPFKAT